MNTENLNQSLRVLNAFLALSSIPFSAMVLYKLLHRYKELNFLYRGVSKFLAFFFIFSCFVGGISGLLSFYLYVLGLGYLENYQVPDGAIVYNLRNLFVNILIFSSAYSAWRFQRSK